MNGPSSTTDSLPAAMAMPPTASPSKVGITGHLVQLPSYSRSLLRIEVPVVVTLATTRLSVKRILDMGPGSILHFEKSYDSPLTLSVGHCDVAVGDAVKVGDKFGIRITSMVMPQEKFEPVRPKST
jgi:flagellar motor switch/type III secretory pathway protein FliN